MFSSLQEQILTPYQEQIEKKIREKLASLPPSLLTTATEYALLSGGKRWRPCLTLMIAKALGRGADVLSSALAVECFHTASLIADDLPSMDNDDQRRDKASLHKAFNEGVALLVSYGLIATGYTAITENVEMLKRQKLSFSSQADFLGILAIRQAAESGGFSGATEGQFLDLYENKLTFETLREVMHKKTVTLFEMAFTFGWLFGGGDPAKLQQIKKAAAHFGIAFQIADDLNDQESDRISGRKANIANLFGEEKAKEMFHVEQQGYLETLKELSIDSPQLQAVAALF